MDIIYSRKKIKIKKLNRIQKLKLIISALVFIIFISVLLYIKAAYPIFIATCKSKANSMAVNIVNEEVQKVVENYSYSDLVNIEKNSEGKITLIQAKVNTINNIVSKITKNIQESIDSSDTGIVYINFGKVTGISILSYIGPTFKIELERARKNKHRYKISIYFCWNKSNNT